MARKNNQRWFRVKIKSLEGKIKMYSVRAGGQKSADVKAEKIISDGTVLFCKKDPSKGRKIGKVLPNKCW